MVSIPLASFGLDGRLGGKSQEKARALEERLSEVMFPGAFPVPSSLVPRG